VTSAITSIFICVGAMLFLLAMLRRGRLSLGLPMAYLITLNLIHLPGAYAYVVSGGVLGGSATVTGIRITAIGVIAFVVGVFLSRTHLALHIWPYISGHERATSMRQKPDYRFWRFCLLGGFALVFGINLILRLPSISAVVEKGGAIWMLGVMLGLAHAFRHTDIRRMAFWGAMMMLYPAMILLIGGFLSYGSTAIIVVFALLLIVTRRYWFAAGMIVVTSLVGISVFVNYFGARTELRSVVWTGASMGDRLDVVGKIVSNFRWFDPSLPAHLKALDERLNQNYFIGVAAERFELGRLAFLNGQTVSEGFLSVIPRILWPDKPVFGGSGQLVANATGLDLDRNTSWGVGNVMEFYINFGLFGVIVGFIVLGILIGGLDRRATEALKNGHLGRCFIFFLPCVALIQPNGSLVELIGSAAAALIAGYAWKQAWNMWSARHRRRIAAARVRRPAFSRS